MRTTVRLPDELYDQVRRRATEEGQTVTSFLEQALRRALAQHDSDRDFVVEPFRGTGTLPGVDLHDNSAMLDVMEG